MDRNLDRIFTLCSQCGYAIFRIFPNNFIKLIIRYFRFGESKFSFGIRYICYKCICKSFGKKVIIFPNVYIFSPENLNIGNNVSIHEFSYIDATGGITIGNNVMIAHRSTIMSSSHKYVTLKKNFKDLGILTRPVTIGNNCWIGADVKILYDVAIGDNCIIGAGSLVNKNIAPFTIAAGIPSKKINKIEDNETS